MRAFTFCFLVLAGCVGEAGYATTGTATVSYTTPDLAPVSADVQVIADYDEPIFYTGGFYWWNYGDGWYRSTDYRGGWVVATPPRAVVTIGSPVRYRHYRPTNYVVRNRPVPVHQIRRPVVRDHRETRR